MSRYAIRATESFYCGYHGVVNWMIAEGTLESATHEGYELAREVIDDYSMLEQYADDVEDLDDEEIDDLYNEYAQCEIHKIKDDCSLSDEEINEAMFQDYDGFVETYCENEDLV